MSEPYELIKVVVHSAEYQDPTIPTDDEREQNGEKSICQQKMTHSLANIVSAVLKICKMASQSTASVVQENINATTKYS